MAKINKVDALPSSIRKALMNKIIQNGYGDYKAISEWLAVQGYPVSKSVLHRLGKGLKNQRESARLNELKQGTEDEARLIELRMRCVESATISGADEVLVTAERYLNWVLGAG